jgi:hypothetical protein
LGWREDSIEHQMDRLNRTAGPGSCDRQRRPCFLRNLKERFGRFHTSGDDDQREAQIEEPRDAPELLVGRQSFEERDLGLTQNLNSSRHHAVGMPNECEPGLLHTRMVDGALLPLLTRNQAQYGVEARLAQETRNGDSTIDPHAGKAALPRRGGFSHGPIIR